MIYVLLKAYRQEAGEYFAVEVERAFSKKEDLDAYLVGKPGSWWEKKTVPLDTGGTVEVDFLGIRSVQETELV